MWIQHLLVEFKIFKIQVNVRKKQEAKTTINDIVQQHKQTIQNNDDATTEEKGSRK